MRDIEKLAIAAVVSLATHAAIGAALEQLPPQDIAQQKAMKVTITRPPPPKPPEQPVEQPKPVEPPPPPKAIEKPVAHPQAHEAAARPPTPPPVVPPPPDRPPSPGNTGDEQVFDGGAISTTSTGTGGPELPLGNGAGGRPAQGSAPTQQAPARPKEPDPIPDYAASTPPLPQGRCVGKYTEDAKTAGIEGVVLLDIVVAEDGRVRDVVVTQRLGHGLDEAAVAALRACRFSPGEQDGKPVAVKIRGFKARFVLSEAP